MHQGRVEVAMRITMPSYYEKKIRALPGVVNVAPFNVFDGAYGTGTGKDNFGQFGTDPRTFLDVYEDLELPPEQVAAWTRDPSGAIASVDLARNLGWKIGDRIPLEGVRFPVNLELNLRGIYRTTMPNGPLFFNWECVEQALHRGKYQLFRSEPTPRGTWEPSRSRSTTCSAMPPSPPARKRRRPSTSN